MLGDLLDCIVSVSFVFALLQALSSPLQFSTCPFATLALTKITLIKTCNQALYSVNCCQTVNSVSVIVFLQKECSIKYFKSVTCIFIHLVESICLALGSQFVDV